MTTVAETLIRGSENLDLMRERANKIVALIRNTYLDLDLSPSHGRDYFTTLASEETWWEFDAYEILTVRCITRHISLAQHRPVIILATNESWQQNSRWHDRSREFYYPKNFGMKGVSLVYESLDLLLAEVFARWPTLRGHLQPMFRAAEMNLR